MAAKKKRQAKKSTSKRSPASGTTRKKAGKKKGRQGGKSATARDLVVAAERTEEVVALRKKGYTLAAIARELGMAKTTVWDAIQRALVEWRNQYASTWEEIRHSAHLQNEALIEANFSRAMAGCPDSARIVHQALERQARLHGLNADKQITAGDSDNPYDGISDSERLRLIFGLIAEADPQAARELVRHFERAQTGGAQPPIDGQAVRKKNTS